MKEVSRRNFLVKSTILAAVGGLPRFGYTALDARSNPPATTQDRYTSFRPGELWLDSSGKPIQAHAGSVIAVGDTFYWAGENKEYTDGKSDIESWGIRFYSSQDLYNWDDLGSLIASDENDPGSPLSPTVFPERPHILFNEKTGKYVCWIKIRGMTEKQFRTVMEADSITGPWRMVHRELRPAGLPAGDFDLVQDPETGKAYMYFERDHKDIVCIDLTDDYLNVTDRYTTHLPGKGPETREAPACFWRKGKLYLTSSGMTGYFPNPSRVAVSDGPHASFTDLGVLHVNDRTETSFGSQISDIFKVPGKKDLYIALADRWLPEFWKEPQFQSGEMSRLARSGITKATASPRQPITPEEREVLSKVMTLKNVNTSISRYVWLPITFKNGRPQIEWRDNWSLEEFADETT